MGGGNAQKTAMARQKAQEKAAKIKKGGTSQLKQNAKAHSYICNICRTAFLCTTNEQMLRDHVAAKHDKSTFEVCFPGYGKA
ncbi:g8067 [Coccomyxa viridis]|uniref:G8067 protein n=1 Tax=Coccomyxa viridis TaxID=1274662 RepID=A0ABP1G667_9CHLO